MSDYKETRTMNGRETASQPAEMGERTEFRPRMGTVTNAPFVKIRKQPSPEADIVTNKQKGDRVKLTAIEGDYYKIIAYGETEGYILRKYIQED